MPVVTLAVIAALALGGTAVAAETSLPGQVLYPVKVHVDENVEGAFALTDMARADWDLSLLGQRISEAQQLAQDGDLSAQAQTDISSNFNVHLSDVDSLIAKLQAGGDASDAAAIAVRLQTVLAVRQELLASTSEQMASGSQEALFPIAVQLQDAVSAAAALSSSTQAQASSSGK